MNAESDFCCSYCGFEWVTTEFKGCPKCRDIKGLWKLMNGVSINIIKSNKDMILGFPSEHPDKISPEKVKELESLRGIYDLSHTIEVED